MGSSPSKQTGTTSGIGVGTAGTSTGDQQNIATATTTPGTDFVRQAATNALSKLSGLSSLRMAGDKLSELQPTTSMSEQSMSTKYSAELPSKSPQSQYLSYSSNPQRWTGA